MYTYAYTYKHIYICMSKCFFKQMLYIHIHIQTYIYMHTHIYIYHAHQLRKGPKRTNSHPAQAGQNEERKPSQEDNEIVCQICSTFVIFTIFGNYVKTIGINQRGNHLFESAVFLHNRQSDIILYLLHIPN